MILLNQKADSLENFGGTLEWSHMAKAAKGDYYSWVRDTRVQIFVQDRTIRFVGRSAVKPWARREIMDGINELLSQGYFVDYPSKWAPRKKKSD